MDMDETRPGWHPLETASEHAEAAVRLARLGRRWVDILSAELDPSVYNTAALADALRQIAVTASKPRIRILLESSKLLVRHKHRLLALARQLPTAIAIRELAPEAELPETVWMMVDGRGALWRRRSEGYRGGWHPDNPGACRLWLREFNALWDYSVESPEVKVLPL